MHKVQILYPSGIDSKILSHYLMESGKMKTYGFKCDCNPNNKADIIIYRGYTINNKNQYPVHIKMLQNWDENRKTLFLHEYYDIIKDNSIPTFFIDSLTDNIIGQISKENKWPRIFIKSSSRSLFSIGEYSSVWPDTSVEEMKREYKKLGLSGPFAIRKFIEDPEIFYNEQRYWILNGNAYHPSGEIPDFVREYGKKMYEFSGSHYFTMDVAGDYIVEINPGESSDRGGDNPLDWFCEIFAKEFLYK